MRQVYRIANAILAAAIALLARTAPAANARNAYVSVSCSETAVSAVVVDGKDFYVATLNAGTSFRATLSVSAIPPFVLVSPAGGSLNLGVGGVSSYLVRDDTGLEDSFGGDIEVLKLDIEQSEANVCWKSTACSLNLTPDSHPGGDVVWTSSPAGISGRGRTISFNPSSLGPGEYTVTARSAKASNCLDSCVVRVVSSTFTVFVDQPGSGGDRDPFELVNDEIDVGHAFWKYEVSYPEHVLRQEVSFFANKTMGYYPATSVKPLSPSAAGCLVIPDDSHLDAYEVEKTWQISLENLMRGLDYARNLHSNPGRYDLNNNNCTDAAIAAGAAVGVVVPATRGTWPLGGGSNPGDLGEDLRGLTE